MSEHRVHISGPYQGPLGGRYEAWCSCGWSHYVPAVVTAAVVWSQHVKEAA